MASQLPTASLPRPGWAGAPATRGLRRRQDGRLVLHFRGGHAGGCPLPLGRRSKPCPWRSALGGLTASPPLRVLHSGTSEPSRPQASQTPSLPGSRPGLGGARQGGPLGDTGPRMRAGGVPSASKNVWGPWAEAAAWAAIPFYFLVSWLKPPQLSSG